MGISGLIIGFKYFVILFFRFVVNLLMGVIVLCIRGYVFFFIEMKMFLLNFMRGWWVFISFL